MIKNKIKLSLIQDYIELYQIDSAYKSISFLNNNTEQMLTNKLLDVYEQLFFKVGLMDVSFLHLKEELKNMDVGGNYTFDSLKNRFDLILSGFYCKIKKIKLSNIEIKYLTKQIGNC